MDPESKKLLDDTFHLAQENNNLLRSMRRSQTVAHAMSLLYWVLILGSIFGSYFLVQPYLGKIKTMYDNASSVLQTFKQ